LPWQRRFAHNGIDQAESEASGANEAHHGTPRAEPEAGGAEEAQHGDDSVSEASASDASLSEASLSESSISESSIFDSTISEESHAEAQKNNTRLTSRPDFEDRPTLRSNVESVAEKVVDNVSKAAQSVTTGTEEAIGYMDDGLGFSPPERPYDEPEPSRGLYVGNLFFDVTPAQLQAEFEKAGKVVKADITRDARGFSKG
jgi:hypothetical protein